MEERGFWEEKEMLETSAKKVYNLFSWHTETRVHQADVESI